MHDANCFITLTYSPEHMPADGSLRVRDWQLFAKRVRKNVGPFRFFHCGEYGEQTSRPHYHACLFGLDFGSDRSVVSRRGGNELYRSATLDELWGLGHASVGSLTYQSALYVAQYVLKKVGADVHTERYRRVDGTTGKSWSVKKEYATMSRRPGLGSSWLSRFKSDVYPSDEVVHAGRAYRPPRYYDSLLPQSQLDALKAKRIRAASQQKDAYTPRRLRDRELDAEGRLALNVRKV